jgi:hypothetical protein
MKYPDFWAAFLNGMSLGTLFAGFAFALLGVLLNALLKTTKRSPLSERTPIDFSWQFFWNDNVKRFFKSGLTTIIVIFLSLRFFKELTGGGDAISMLYCFGVGFGLDMAIAALKKKAGIPSLLGDEKTDSNG